MKQKLTFNDLGYYSYPNTYCHIICKDFVGRFIPHKNKYELPDSIVMECVFKNPKKKGFKKIAIVEKNDNGQLFFVNISGKPFLDDKGEDDHYIFDTARERIGSRREMWIKITCAD